MNKEANVGTFFLDDRFFGFFFSSTSLEWLGAMVTDISGALWAIVSRHNSHYGASTIAMIA